jgi:hypothetical protein
MLEGEKFKTEAVIASSRRKDRSEELLDPETQLYGEECDMN